jgi:hypothetical protein
MTEERSIEICKRGQGAECCRYLAVYEGFRCAKLTDGLREMIDKRSAEGTMGAKGDNCEGIPFDE